MTFSHCVTNISFGTIAPESADIVRAMRVSSARRTCTFVVVDTARRSGVAIKSVWAVAAMTALKIYANGAWPTSVGMCTLVDVDAPIVRVPLESRYTVTRIVSRIILTQRVDAARSRPGTLVDVRAVLFSIAFEAWLTLASKARRKVTALCVFNASSSYRWIETLVDV